MSKKKLLAACVLLSLAICVVRPASTRSDTMLVPLGLMGPSGDTPVDLGTEEAKLADVALGGFNIVHEFRAVQDIAQAEEYLLRAGAEGLLVVQNMPICRAYELPLCEHYPEVGVWDELEWAAFISTLAEHENLVAWYLPDEIDNFQAAANLYEWVKTYDPLGRPVYANPGSFDQEIIDLFPAFSDLIWAAAYPDLRGEPRALVTHMAEMDAQACQGTDTRWGPIVQFFDSSEFPQYGSVKRPTPQELRSDSYQAIIAGAKGLWYFNYEMGKEKGLDDLWQEMSKIADEINGTGGLGHVILAPDVPQGIQARVIAGPAHSPPTPTQPQGRVYGSVQYLQKWSEGDGTYIFAVNVATDTVTAEFWNVRAETDSVTVLFEDRSVAVSDELWGSFRDTLARDEVHIYFYPGSAPPPPLSFSYFPITARP